MHNVLTSRMILHLREHARLDMGFTTVDLQAYETSTSLFDHSASGRTVGTDSDTLAKTEPGERECGQASGTKDEKYEEGHITMEKTSATVSTVKRGTLTRLH